MMRQLILANRSHRRFQEDKPISRDTLVDLIELARLIPSAGNKQPLKYILTWTPEKNGVVFSTLAWAAYLKDWRGPAEGERPTGYVVILGDNEIAETIPWDHAIAAQTIVLGAVSIDRKVLREKLKIPARYEILLAVALGHPNETVVIDEIKNGDYKYWRDEKSVHHVPKRSLSELILHL